MSAAWTEISCEVPASMVDIVADFLVDLSGNGVSIENLSVDTFSIDTLEDSPVKTVKGYFPADNAIEQYLVQIEAFLRARGPAFSDFQFKNPAVAIIDQEDWANNWKKYFKPVRIGSRLVIKPTWEDYTPAEGDLVLNLDPGMAFGTGAHPTTKMCLEVLEEVFGVAGIKGEIRAVLDVGTGSGVLSIAAAKLGAGHVVAVDIDEDAVAVAAENAALNGCREALALSTTPLSDLSETFQIVLANILAEELVRLSDQLVARVAPGGALILSGILTEKEAFVLDGFAAHGLAVAEIRREAEWSCIWLRKETV